MKYSIEYHLNSKRSRGVREQINSRRLLAQVPLRDFETDPLQSAQVWRGGPDAQPLPIGFSPALLRAYRSKYEPHVGAKQLARAAR